MRELMRSKRSLGISSLAHARLALWSVFLIVLSLKRMLLDAVGCIQDSVEIG